ncbi:MAG: lipocalin family protein [Deltaproteobacteria bacterium]
MALHLVAARRLTTMAMMVALGLGAAACGSSSSTDPGGLDPRNLSDGYTKSWLLTRYSVDGVDIRIPSYAADNVYLFNYDGTGLVVYGEVDGTAGDTVKVDDLTWSMSGSTFIIEGSTSPAPVGRTVAAIVTLTPTSLVYEYDRLVSGGVQKIRCTYTRAVAYDAAASSLNKSLTNGQTKIWSLQSVVPAGVIPVDPTAPLDNLLILSTDGTGYLTRPDSTGQKGTTANTDFVRWTTVSNDLTLEMIGLDAVAELPWTSTLVTATSAQIVIRGDVVTESGSTTVTMAYVPFVAIPH